MNTTSISIVTTKGQVVIPKQIRDQFNIKPADFIKFSAQKNKIIIEAIDDVDEMYGFISKNKPRLSKNQLKMATKKAVIAKFKKEGKK